MIKDLRYCLYAGFMLVVCRKLGMASEGATLFIGMFLTCYGKETIEFIKAYRIHRKIRKSLKKLRSEEES